MARHLVSCKKDDRLESGSDHYPITTLLALESPPQSQQQRQQRRNWKKMDRDGVAAGAEHLPQPGALATAEEIEDYTTNLLEFLEGLVERTVPAAKDTVGYSCPWWTQDVEEEV